MGAINTAVSPSKNTHYAWETGAEGQVPFDFIVNRHGSRSLTNIPGQPFKDWSHMSTAATIVASYAK